MENTVLGAGIACIVAAIAGGGIKLLGAEIPILSSARRQILLAGFGAILIAGASAGNWTPYIKTLFSSVFPSDTAANTSKTGGGSGDYKKERDEKHDRLTKLSQRLQGSWREKLTLGPNSLYPPNLTNLGTCMGRTSEEREIVFSGLNESRAAIEGRYTWSIDEEVDFTQSQESIPMPSSYYETQRTNCSNVGLHDPSISQLSKTGGGDLSITEVAEDNRHAAANLNVTDCDINGKKCPASDFGDQDWGDVVIISDSKIKLHGLVFEREGGG